MKDVNYNIVQGDTFPLVLTYRDSSGSAVPLTNASALMEVRDVPGGTFLAASAVGYSASPLLNDGIVITASAGQLAINLTPAKTSRFNIPRSAYQVRVTLSDGSAVTLLKGWFEVDPGVIP